MHYIIITMISGDNAKSMGQRAHPTICDQTLFALHSEACKVWKICTFLFVLVLWLQSDLKTYTHVYHAHLKNPARQQRVIPVPTLRRLSRAPPPATPYRRDIFEGQQRAPRHGRRKRFFFQQPCCFLWRQVLPPMSTLLMVSSPRSLCLTPLYFDLGTLSQ